MGAQPVLCSLALLLVLGLAGAAEAPPPLLRTWSGSAPGPPMRQHRTWAMSAATAPPAVTAAECPGVAGGACGKACQLRLCQTLADFYRISNNVTDSWAYEYGWDRTVTMPCERLVAASPRRAVYCNWYGVRCCTPEDVAAGNCSVVDAISALEVPINNINVSLSHPGLLPALKMLHDCGMTVLDLSNNNIAGAFTDAWGAALHHLTFFSFGCCWAEGTIPRGLRLMRNLTYLDLSNNWLNGTMPDWFHELRLLRVLNLGSQFGGNQGTPNLGLQGQFPDLSGLAQLREVNFEANSLTGPLPPKLCPGDDDSMLVLLTLRSNQLNGSAQAVEGCGNLVQLDLSSNMFTGSLPASSGWDELSTYRVNNNMFTGSIPLMLTRAARILEHLDISGNRITGMIPSKIVLLSNLKTMSLSGNLIHGTINENIAFLPALMKLDLSNNSFVGKVPSGIGLAYSLVELDVSNNANLTGMLPPQMGMLSSLRLVRTTSTTMSCAGIIKPYTITTNNSCMNPERCTTPRMYGDAETANQRCPAEQLLPCFLRFSDYLVPRDDDSNMRCRVIMRLPTGEAQRRCASTGPDSLGEQARQMPDVPADFSQAWLVDPSYYQYQACECLLGYKQQWNGANTVLRCVPDDSPRSQTAVIVGVAAAAAVLVAGLLVFRQYLATRPRWLRERVMQSKRAKGAPRAAKPGDVVRVSIVVTDVQDYAELTRRNPELMAKAMGGHNNILRKACHSHAGYVLDQEGDSWTVAFHDAEDAVAFSLQVQQALGHKVWGASPPARSGHVPRLALLGSGHSDNSSSYDLMAPDLTSTADGSTTQPSMSAASLYQAIAGGGVGGPGRLTSSFTSSHRSAQTRSSGREQHSGEHMLSPRALEPGILQLRPDGPDDAPSHSTLPELQSGGDPSRPGEAFHAAVDRRQVSFSDAGQSMRSRQSSGQLDLRGGHYELRGQLSTRGSLTSSFDVEGSLVERLASSRGGSSTISRPRSSGGSRLWSAGAALVRRISQFGRGGLMRGPGLGLDEEGEQRSVTLAVRIGVATGMLPFGTDVATCAVKERAKGCISDMAHGGQVLLDEQTFKQIKDSLSTLGTVHAEGYQDKALQQLLQAQAASRLQRRVACKCLRPARTSSFTGQVERDPQDYDADAIVVHMGAFQPSMSLAAAAEEEVEGDGSMPSTPSASSVGDGMERTASATAQAGSGPRPPSAKQPRLPPHLQLYAIAAPGMRKQPGNTRDLQRSTAWCRPLHPLRGWAQTQKSYFEAPGARAIDLCLTAGGPDSFSRSALPDVTVLFVQLAGGPAFAAKHSRREAHSLAKGIRRCMMQLMSVVPGGDGYLCHCYEPEFKYLIAFEAPYRAAQWALLLQEALMYVTWPAYVLAHPGWQEVLDPTTGRPLFRGPRLRIGLAEGQPTSVVPDHWGRANYQGSAIIKAARFMDAAAHGGQVVTDVDTARKLARLWSAQDSLDEANTVSCGASLNAGSISARLPSSVALPDDSAALQAQQDPGSQPASPPDLPGSQQPQLQGAHAQPASSAGPSFSLQPLVSGSSAAASSGHLSGGGMQCAWSTWGLGPTGNEGAVLEPVKAACIGAFTFKGSGTFQMVQLAHASLAARTFPDEPPRGKGFRVSMPEGALALEGFECVSLAIPARLLAARRAFKAIKQLGMEEGS